MAEKSIEQRRPDAPAWWPDVFGRRFADWFDWPLMTMGETDRMLRVEEFVDGKELVVRAEIPGIDPDKDVHVHVRNHVLEIRAERNEKSEAKDKAGRRSEFRYGSFFRSISLPPDAKDTDVSATYKDGILEVRVPRDAKQADVTKVPVTRP